MDPGNLAQRMAEDRAGGRRPAAVVASIGSPGVTAFDPLPAIVAAAADHGCWVHADAAMAGTAMLVPEFRHLWAGVEGVDSLCWNPHKWMGTVLDTSLYYVRDVEQLTRVMSTNPSYLRSSQDGRVVQYRDWGIPLGRRFRALKLLFQLRLDGVEALQARVRRDVANARWLADQAVSTPGWEVVAPVPLQTGWLRHRGGDGGGGVTASAALSPDALDRHTRRWAAAVNGSGQAYVTPSLLGGQWMVRVSVGVEGPEADHVERLWGIINHAATASWEARPPTSVDVDSARQER